MNWFFKYKVHHILFWILYYVFWTWFSMHFYGTPLFGAIISTTIYFIAQAGAGYFSIYYLLPHFFFTKRYAAFILTAIVTILLGGFFITSGLNREFPLVLKQIGFGTYFLYSVFSVFSTTLLFISVSVIRERVNAQKMNSILEKEKTEQELKFLKAQTNPHFLFNAINSIYVLIKKDPDLAEATLARFSDMLRYQLYECNFAEVPVSKEIEYLDNYIEMERLRKGSALAIHYKKNLSTRNFLISPLLIIPFIENAFKHVSNFSGKGNFIEIELNDDHGQFRMDVRNSLDGTSHREAENPASGIGQENTKRRLKLIYPNRHTLTIKEDAEIYFVSLTIDIT